MSSWTRKASVLVLGLVLVLGVGCASEESLSPSVGQPSQSLVSTIGGTVAGTMKALDELHLLSCSTQPYAVTTKVIGPQGGIVTVGTHRLVIPAGALDQSVTIKAEQVPGNVNSVRFSPEGLQFALPASLELSYSNCSPLMISKRVVYTDENLRILDLLPSLDLLRFKTVTGVIKHFSRYAVAW